MSKLTPREIDRRRREGIKAKRPKPKETSEQRKARELAETKAALCPHMLDAINALNDLGISVGGSGDFGSPWLSCGRCKHTADYVSRLFADQAWA